MAACCLGLLGLGLWSMRTNGLAAHDAETAGGEGSWTAPTVEARPPATGTAECTHRYFGGTSGNRLTYRLEQGGEVAATIRLAAEAYDREAGRGRVAYRVDYDDGRGDRRASRIDVDCDDEQADDPLESMLTAGLELRIPPLRVPSELVESSRECVTQQVATLRMERCVEVRSLRSSVSTPAGEFTAVELLRTDRLVGRTEAQSVSRVWLVEGIGVVRREQTGDGSALVLARIESRR